MSKEILQQITAVNVRQLPKDVRKWLIDDDIRTHGGNDIAYVEELDDDDNPNPFADWLKSEGFVFTEKDDYDVGYAYIGIFGT